MATAKLHAAIHRFHKPQSDRAYGGLVLDRKHGWKPSDVEREEIDEL
jgi:hypothetical protein